MDPKVGPPRAGPSMTIALAMTNFYMFAGSTRLDIRYKFPSTLFGAPI